jgi:hypothetical protein
MSDDQPQAPLPPYDLDRRPLPLCTLVSGSLLYRLHVRSKDALFFGPAPGEPPAGRFDAQGGVYGTCYLGHSLEACFVEKLCRQTEARTISLRVAGFLDLAEIEVLSSLRVVELHGPGLATLGATAAVAHGPYRASRAWGRALFGHPVRLDGIQYRSRLDDGQLCLALFDRCAPHLRAGTSAPLLNDWSRFEQLVERYRRAIVDEV